MKRRIKAKAIRHRRIKYFNESLNTLVPIVFNVPKTPNKK